MLKRQELEPYTFDYSAHRNPLAYQTFVSAVELLHRTKLIPPVKNTLGAVFLKYDSQSNEEGWAFKPLETNNLEIDVEF